MNEKWNNYLFYSSYIGFWGGLRYPAIELDINKF